jgi:Glucose/sorbosone dehydrogenases
MAMNPWSDALWLNEHGPRGGDEINIPEKGQKLRLAGWRHTGSTTAGLKIPEAKGEHVEGTEKPLFVWKVSPAVSGMAFYNRRRLPAVEKQGCLSAR